jgi:hypothetical protein
MSSDRQALEDFKKITEERFILNESGIYVLEPMAKTEYAETTPLFTQEVGNETIIKIGLQILAQMHGSDAEVWDCDYAFEGGITGISAVGTPVVSKRGSIGYGETAITATFVKTDPEYTYPNAVQISVVGDSDTEYISWAWTREIRSLHFAYLP